MKAEYIEQECNPALTFQELDQDVLYSREGGCGPQIGFRCDDSFVVVYPIQTVWNRAPDVYGDRRIFTPLSEGSQVVLTQYQ